MIILVFPSKVLLQLFPWHPFLPEFVPEFPNTYPNWSDNSNDDKAAWPKVFRHTHCGARLLGSNVIIPVYYLYDLMQVA